MKKTGFFLFAGLTILFLGLIFGCSLSGDKEQKYDTTSIDIAIGALGTFSAKAALGTYDDVVRVTIEVAGEDKYGVPQDPLVSEQDLVQGGGGEWTGTINGLPIGPVLTFRASGYDSGDVVIFSGVTTQVLTGVSDSVIVAMDPESDGVPINFPRVWTIRLPIEIINDTDANIEVGVEGNADESLSYEFSNGAGGGIFTPNPGGIVLPGSGNGTFNVTYTAPSEVGIHGQTVKVINSQGNSVEVDFDTDVVYFLSGDAGAQVLFAPVVVSLNGKRNGAVVTWTAEISDDKDLSELTYLWDFSGSSGVDFIDPAVNPADFAGYDETKTGVITLSVTDGDGLTTTITFDLVAGQFPDDVLFFEPGIALDVAYIDDTLDGRVVYATSFTGDGKVPDDTVEIKSAVLSNGSARLNMDNYDSGYPEGSYGILAHIDVNNDGILTAQSGSDYVALGEVTIGGGSVSTVINGPWGSYFAIIVNSSPPAGAADKTMYLALVAQGDYWGNYAYGEADFPNSSGFRGIDCWAPDGDYEFLAFVDTNENMGVTGGPDTGDWVITESVNVVGGVPNGGVMPTFTWTVDSWTVF
jgi:hypothetical protein